MLKGSFPPALTSALARAAGMRAILVHDYARIDREILATTVGVGLPELRAFGAAIGSLLPH